MKNFMLCRRTYITTLGIVAATILGLVNQVDVTMALAGMVGALCAANSYEASSRAKQDRGPEKYVGGAPS
jgi:hypothetical protein